MGEEKEEEEEHEEEEHEEDEHEEDEERSRRLSKPPRKIRNRTYYQIRDASNPVVERELVKRHFPRCKVPAISTGEMHPAREMRRCLGGKLKLRSTLSSLETSMRRARS